MIALITPLLQSLPIDIPSVLQEYGWLGFLLYIFAEKVLPWLQSRFDAEYQARQVEKEEERKAEAAQKAELTHALVRFSDQMHVFGLALNTAAERLTQIERMQSERFDRIENEQDIMREALSILADRQLRSRVVPKKEEA